MFVKIKNCNPNKYTNDLDRQSAIQIFLEAHGERKHIVYCPINTCKEIISSDLFGNVQNKYSNDLLDLKNEIGTLKSMFKVILTVDFSLEYKQINNVLNNDCFEITCSYHYLLSNSFKNRCIFLAEDESDCEFFTLIADTISSINFGRNVSVSFNNLEGGGSRTHRKYVNMLLDNEFGLCIVDNDRKHPAGSEGGTSKKFKSNQGQRGFAVNQECLVLDFHEAESIIPEHILEQVVDQKKIDVLDKMANNDKISKFQYRKYFDHKLGIDLKAGWSLDGLQHQPFWVDFFKLESNFQIKPCRPNKLCVNKPDNIQCNSCIKLEGLGSKILEDSITIMKNVHLRPIFLASTPHIKSQWDFIGKKVLDWGCVLSLPPIKSF